MSRAFANQCNDKILIEVSEIPSYQRNTSGTLIDNRLLLRPSRKVVITVSKRKTKNPDAQGTKTYP